MSPDRHSYSVALEDGRLVVEFPWRAGATSSMLLKADLRMELLNAGEQLDAGERDRASLLQLMTTVVHPMYGKGILSQLAIPLRVDQADIADRIADRIDELNRWELSGDDLAPLFGAWSAGPEWLTFVSFTPNQFCLPGLLTNLVGWARVRHDRVRQ